MPSCGHTANEKDTAVNIVLSLNIVLIGDQNVDPTLRLRKQSVVCGWDYLLELTENVYRHIKVHSPSPGCWKQRILLIVYIL